MSEEQVVYQKSKMQRAVRIAVLNSLIFFSVSVLCLRVDARQLAEDLNPPPRQLPQVPRQRASASEDRIPHAQHCSAPP